MNVNSMTIQSSRNTCIQVNVVQHSETLIVMYKKGPFAAKNIVAIKECMTMLRNGKRMEKDAGAAFTCDSLITAFSCVFSLVCALVRNLHQSTR